MEAPQVRDPVGPCAPILGATYNVCKSVNSTGVADRTCLENHKRLLSSEVIPHSLSSKIKILLKEGGPIFSRTPPVV
jgi:hypothetical protein